MLRDTVTAITREAVAGSSCWNGARLPSDQAEYGEASSAF